MLTTAADEAKGPCAALISAPGFVQDQLADDLRLDIQEEPQIQTFEMAVKRRVCQDLRAKISGSYPHSCFCRSILSQQQKSSKDNRALQTEHSPAGMCFLISAVSLGIELRVKEGQLP